MTSPLARVFRALLKTVLVIGILVLALFAMLLAWWTALLLIVAWLGFAGTRRWRGAGRKPAPPPGATIIEGEYRVEPNSQAQSTPAIATPRERRLED